MKRLLAVYDYSYMPWSIGDMTLFMMYSENMREKLKCVKIDYCILNIMPRTTNNNITETNKAYYVFQFMQLLQLSPSLGTVVCMDDMSEFYRYINNHNDNVVMFPSMSNQLSKSIDIFKGIGTLNLDYEHILAIPEQSKWFVKNVYEKYCDGGRLPIAVTLRKNPDKCVRNAAVGTWFSLFSSQVNKPLHFFILGSREEYDDCIDKLPNVTYTKNIGASLIDDIAFIDTCSLYIGTQGGMYLFALSSDTPFLLFQVPKNDLNRAGLMNLHTYQKTFTNEDFNMDDIIKVFEKNINQIPFWKNKYKLDNVAETVSYPVRVR